MSMVLTPGVSVLAAGSNTPKIQDSELVINTLNNQGETSNIQVLTHLRAFGTGTTTVQYTPDYKLSSIRNLYGSQDLSTNNNELSVNIDMNSSRGYGDVYYMSQLDKSEISKAKMPVSVQVSYYLNGQKMEPSELAGKSGHLKIVTELENLTGTQKSLEYKDSQGNLVKTNAEVYTPYVVSLSGWEFDNKIFSHVVAPGVSGVSPEGVVADVQGKSTVSWSIPLIPPAYPAKQYVTLEADGTNIQLPSFNIAVVPILPATSEENTLGTVQDSLKQLYSAFGQIQDGVGTPTKNGTLMFGLTSLKSGLSQLSGGIATLGDKIKLLATGVSNPRFNASTFNASKGVDANGNKPGVKEAVGMAQAALNNQVIPALEGQKQVLAGLGNAIGKPGANPVMPSISTSLCNDVSFLNNIFGTQASIGNSGPVMPSASTSLYNDASYLQNILDGAFKGTPNFDASTFDPAKGTDANGNKPGVRDAIKLGKAALDNQVIPAIEAQKQVLTGIATAMGQSGTAPVQPTASTSLYNDVSFLDKYLQGSMLSDVIDKAIEPKILALENNVNVLNSGGTLKTPNGDQPFPADLNTLEQGIKTLSGAMAQTDAGLGLYQVGVDKIIGEAMLPKIGAVNQVVGEAVIPKLGAIENNIGVLKDGGTLITPQGSVAFPASVSTVEQGIKTLSGAMAQTSSGLNLISAGIGPVDANGQPVKVMVNGQPGTILYALSYFKNSIDSQALPGLDQLLAGSSKIGAGSGQAKTAISAGLDKMLSAPAIVSAMKDDVAQADSFLGTPKGAGGAVVYIYQTPQISNQSPVMNYGLGAIILAIIILFAAGRPRKTTKTVQTTSQNA
jgi:hypothetical protein